MFVIVVNGIDGLDGEYPFPADLTNRELRTIKQMSGVRAGEVEEAVTAGDNDFYIALTAIACRRSGKPFVEDMLWDAVAGTITVAERPEDGEGEARPPAVPLEPAPGAPSGASGPSSSESGEPSPETSSPSGSGTPDSDTGAISDQGTSPTLRQVS